LTQAPAFGRNRREDLAPSHVCAAWLSQPCEAELDEEILVISCVDLRAGLEPVRM